MLIPTRSLSYLLAASLGLSFAACKPRKDGAESDVLAYTQQQVSAQFGVRLIPEVVNLASGQAIPPHILDDYDDRTISESLVYRLHQTYDDLSGGSAIANQRWLDDSILGMRFDDKLIDKIGLAGFLNQHQTKTTHGSTDRALRLKAEQVLADLGLESGTGAGKLILPKYSWLSLDNSVPQGKKTDDASQYGNWIAVFRKEVKFRSTLTYDDSLNRIADGSFKSYNRRAFQSTFYSTDAYAKDGSYLEAQIWGALDFSDVERFLIPGGSAPASLTRYGIPVSRYTAENRAGRYSIVIGQELYNGDPAKLEAYRGKRWTNRHFNGEDGSVPLDTPPVKLIPTSPARPPAEPLKAPLARIDLVAKKFGGTTADGKTWKVEIQDEVIVKTTIDGAGQTGPWNLTNKLPQCLQLKLDKRTRSQFFHIVSTDQICFAGDKACDETAATTCLDAGAAAAANPTAPPPVAGPETELTKAALVTRTYAGRGPDGKLRKIEFVDETVARYSGASNEFPGTWIFQDGDPKCVLLTLEGGGRRFWYWIVNPDKMCFAGDGANCDSSSQSSCIERR